MYLGAAENRIIKNYIDRSKYKHKDLAAAIGLQAYSFSERYRGIVRWKLSEIQSLAEVLGVNAADLIGW